ITSWTDTKIECVVPDYYDGRENVYLFKSGVNDYRYDGTTYWRTLPSGIVKLLGRATAQDYGRIWCEGDFTLTFYDDKGKVTGTSQYSSTFEEYLSTSSPTNVIFKVTGRSFQSAFSYSSNTNDRVECNGTVSADGKTLETVTVTRSINGNIIKRISFANVPVSSYNRYSDSFNWTFAVNSNATAYITDLYAATYSNNGKLQNDTKLKNGKKVEFRLQCKYK
ncbi:MAG: hypothetical protein JNL32_14515, partial [Candidatus Kapabacteria bacterium]|nr:hypothetical protein [Candidatus Kapabacteria bacterium]